MTDKEPEPFTFIQETVLKKRKSNQGWAIKRRQRMEQSRLRSKKDKDNPIKTAEQYIKEYREKELDLVQMKNRGKRRRPTLVTLKSKLLFIIRIQGKSEIHPRTRKILHTLRLWRTFTGVFMRANDKLLEMLQKVEPHITYGYPNLKNVRELIYKKGHARINKQRVPLTDNNIIEEALGKHGIICIEDIVHEIANVGPHFKEVSGFLWPLVLNKPGRGALTGLRKAYKDGGDAGNRDEHINELISKMN